MAPPAVADDTDADAPPPQLPALLRPRSDAELSALRQEALAYAAANGLLMAVPPAQQPAPEQTLYGHAPFALLPDRFPAREYVRARDLAPLFNTLVDRVASDGPWMLSALESVLEHDDFTRRLVEIYQALEMQPPPSSSSHPPRRPVPRQHVRLGVNRSDYMLHGASLEEATILQVEVNTIAASFAALSSRASALHHYLAHKVLGAPQPTPTPSLLRPLRSPAFPLLPANEAVDGLAHGLALAHDEYLKQERALWRSNAYGPHTPAPLRARPCVLMIVQPGERNVIDQKLLETTLWERYRVPLVRASLLEISVDGRLDLGRRHNLLLRRHRRGRGRAVSAAAAEGEAGAGAGAGAEAAPTVWAGGEDEEEDEEVEVTVAYFRAGYAPGDYPGEGEWKGRELVEMSAAVKCPSVAYQLAGTKKVQEALSRPGELERFLPDPAQARAVRACFAGLFGLEPGSPQAAAAVAAALARPGEFVLKPQREGGGNNFYGDEMVAALTRMTEEERAAFILMERIRPPVVEALLVRDGAVARAPSVYELGVYGIFVGDGRTGRVLLNASCGHLLRTKPETSNEGGVAAGFAVLSSPLLVAPAPGQPPLTPAEAARLLRYATPTAERRAAGRRRRLRAAVAVVGGVGVVAAVWMAVVGGGRRRGLGRR